MGSKMLLFAVIVCCAWINLSTGLPVPDDSKSSIEDLDAYNRFMEVYRKKYVPDSNSSHTFTPSELRWALAVAASDGEDQAAEVLIRNGVDVNSRVLIFQVPPLHFAVSWDHPSVVEHLLENGADIDLIDKYGQTSLFKAIAQKHADIAKILIKYGADVNAATVDHATPLQAAAELGYDEIVELLIEAGADVNARNVVGASPLYLAKKKGHTNIVDILKNAGAVDL